MPTSRTLYGDFKTGDVGVVNGFVGERRFEKRMMVSKRREDVLIMINYVDYKFDMILYQE